MDQANFVSGGERRTQELTKWSTLALYDELIVGTFERNGAERLKRVYAIARVSSLQSPFGSISPKRYLYQTARVFGRVQVTHNLCTRPDRHRCSARARRNLLEQCAPPIQLRLLRYRRTWLARWRENRQAFDTRRMSAAVQRSSDTPGTGADRFTALELQLQERLLARPGESGRRGSVTLITEKSRF